MSWLDDMTSNSGAPSRVQYVFRADWERKWAGRFRSCVPPGEGPENYSGSVPGLVMDSRLAQPRGKLRQSAGIANLARVAVGNSLPSLGTAT